MIFDTIEKEKQTCRLSDRLYFTGPEWVLKWIPLAALKTKPYSNVFNAGFFIGVGTLFYLNLIVILPAFFIGISILTRESSWR